MRCAPLAVTAAHKIFRSADRCSDVRAPACAPATKAGRRWAPPLEAAIMARSPAPAVRIAACGSCCWRLISGMTCRPSWSTTEAPSAATAPGLSNVFMVELDPSLANDLRAEVLALSAVRRTFASGLHGGAASVSLRLLTVSADAWICGSWNDALTRCLIHLRSSPTGLPRRRGESFTHGGPSRSRSNLRRVSTERPNTWLVCRSVRTAQSGSALSCRSTFGVAVILRSRAKRRSLLRLSARMTRKNSGNKTGSNPLKNQLVTSELFPNRLGVAAGAFEPFPAVPELDAQLLQACVQPDLIGAYISSRHGAVFGACEPRHQSHHAAIWTDGLVWAPTLFFLRADVEHQCLLLRRVFYVRSGPLLAIEGAARGANQWGGQFAHKQERRF